MKTPNLQLLWEKLAARREPQPALLLRARPACEGTDPMPAMGLPAFTVCAQGQDAPWHAPQLICRDDAHWLLAGDEQGRACLAALENGVRGPWQYLPLGGAYAYPLVFDWNRDCFLLAADENGWQLFWSPEFPAQWDPVAHFDLPAGLIAPVAVPGRESMGILFSEPDEKHPEQTRVHLYELTRDEADPQKFLLQPDEGFAFTHRAFLPAHLNAGPVFAMDGRPVRVCAQGEYLQFYLAEGDALRPLCAATPHNVRAELPAGQKTESIHAYARDEQYECLAVMLTR